MLKLQGKRKKENLLSNFLSVYRFSKNFNRIFLQDEDFYLDTNFVKKTTELELNKE